MTNPKNALFKTTNNREPLERALHSTHIRMLIFSNHPVTSVQVFIDDVYMGQAKPAESSDTSSLYILKWNPASFAKGLHRIKVEVEVGYYSFVKCLQSFYLIL